MLTNQLGLETIMSWLKRQVSNQGVHDPESMSAAVAAAAFAIQTLEENGADHSPQPRRKLTFNKMKSLGEASMRQLTMKNREAPDRAPSTSRPTRSSSSITFIPTPSDTTAKAVRNSKPKSVLSWANGKMSKATTKSGSRNVYD